MALRRYGPIQAAGTSVTEKDAEKTLQGGIYGVSAMLTLLEWGPNDRLISTFSKKQYLKKCGTRIPEATGPGCGIDFWDESDGMGELHLIRVEDGTGRCAGITLWNRASPKGRALLAEGKYNGRRAGRQLTKAGEVETIATDIGETTLKVNLDAEPFLGWGMKTDEWKGGTISLDGVSGKTYVIISNTSAAHPTIPGVISVKAGSKMKTDLGVSVDKGYVLRLAGRADKVIDILVDDGELDPANNFSIKIFADGEYQKTFGDLSMDPASEYYVVPAVNGNTDNEWIKITDLHSPSLVTPESRPATGYGPIWSLTSTQLTKVLHQASVSSPTGADPIVTLGTTNDNMRYEDELTITMTSGSAGTVVSKLAGPLGTISLAGGPPLTGTLASPTPVLPDITVTNGTTVLALGDVVTIEYFPWEPGALVGGFIAPDEPGTRLMRFRVAANDHKSATIYSGDFTAAGAAGSCTISTGVAATGQVTCLAPGTHPTGIVNGDTVTIPVSATVSKTFEFNTGSVTPPNIKVDITGLTTAAQVAAALAAAVTTAAYGMAAAQGTGGNTDKVNLTNQTRGTGGNQSITKSAGNPVTVTGMTGGLDDATVIGGNGSAFLNELPVGSFLAAGGVVRRVATVTANDAATVEVAFPVTLTEVPYRIIKSFQVYSRRPLEGGYDGLAGVTDADYLKHLDPSTSYFKRLQAQCKGLVKLACPGKTSTAIQKAGFAFCDAFGGWHYRVEVPANITDEAALVDYVNNTLGRNDFAVGAWPSYWYVNDPDKPGLEALVPITGMVMGEEAKFANTYLGYHKAASDTTAVLSKLIRPPADSQLEINDEITNPLGMQIITKKDGNFVIWGDRTLSADPAWRWKHQREWMSHMINILRGAFNWIIFAINDPTDDTSRLKAKNALRSLLEPEWRPKHALVGRTFDEACPIKIDGDNNTLVTAAQGNLNAEVKPRIVDTTERMNITMSKAGIYESIG